MRQRFYSLPKQKRDAFVAAMRDHIHRGLADGDNRYLMSYAASPNTHIRKWAYTVLGRIYHEHRELWSTALAVVEEMLLSPNQKVRQTAVYAAGAVGDLRVVADILETGLRDPHYSVRNGVIGALKVIGSKDPPRALAFARRHIKDDDPEVRRQIVHGIELHGRTCPQEILPLLADMQGETNKRVCTMIVHVIGQISYKEGCLETVIDELRGWGNRDLRSRAIVSILAVHREQTYCAHSYKDAREYIRQAGLLPGGEGKHA